MRTATTLAKTHDGKWQIVAAPEVPIQNQLSDFRKMLGHKDHAEFSEVRFQESDGAARVLKFAGKVAPAKTEIKPKK